MYLLLHATAATAPTTVWSTDLIIYYVISKGALGEAWTPYSWLQAVGMLVLFAGTAVYNGSLRIPGLEYDHRYAAIDGVDATPALTRSPLLARTAVEYCSPSLSESVRRAKAAKAAGGVVPPRKLRTGSAERQNFLKEDEEDNGYL